MRLGLIFACALIAISFGQFAPESSQNPAQSGLHVQSFTENSITLEWKIPTLELSPVPTGPTSFYSIDFAGGRYLAQPGKPRIPYYEFTLGVPDGAKIQGIVSQARYETRQDVIPMPVSVPGKDRRGISIDSVVFDSLNYDYAPAQILEVSEQYLFRDLPVVRIKFYPLRYQAGEKVLTVLQQAVIKIVFSVPQIRRGTGSTDAALQDMYASQVLNFEQAKNWLVDIPRSMSRRTAFTEGPWFRMEVSQEGMYRINRAVLAAAGIDVTALDPRTIKIYNHGGMHLPLKTGGVDPAALGPVETSILVQGEADGVFDTDDYILFYAKPLGGWFYSATENDFTFQQHLYDTKNYYWLTYGGMNGKRMAVIAPPVQPATVTDTYFMQRAHFEEDKYNLLSSGAEWYGHRFYGLSASASFTYNLDYSQSMPQSSRMRLKVKSGNGIRYLDPAKYNYRFTVYLNPTKNSVPLLSNRLLNSRVDSTYTVAFNSDEYLVNGNNTMKVEYRGNLTDCNAYMDWVEFYYPHPLSVTDNALNFFTNTGGQPVRYGITGFSATDARMYDITNPVDVTIRDNETGIQNGIFDITLDLSDGQPRHLLITSLNSPAVKTVSNLVAFETGVNLLANSLGADLLIITHPSFLSYAEEIAALRSSGRDPLRCQVINVSDIYFYFSSGVKDVVAVRDFIRYAYYNWTPPRPRYVLLFGDGHYDYRNIALSDTNRIPPFEISANYELECRETDNFFVDINYNLNTFSSISPDLAIGRLPAESRLDARRIVDKLLVYDNSGQKDGWQTVLTFVADDEIAGSSTNEWLHQRDTERLAQLPEIKKFIKQKVYLSAYKSVPGGFGRVKPEANQAIIDQLNEGTLIINYVGHGSPETWSHEYSLTMSRDLSRIQNEGRVTFWIAATCDFGKFDDPKEPSFTEALIWAEKQGAIGVVSSSRLVSSTDNYYFNRALLTDLFENGDASKRLGDAFLAASGAESNDQKYHLFGDPSMYLADPRNEARILSVSPDTMKALSKVRINGSITSMSDFSGGAYLIVNDAQFDSVNTGGPDFYTLLGPRIFRGEVSVAGGLFSGEFVVPKSIRYHYRPTGRVTVYAWSEDNTQDAIGYADTLLFNGTVQNLTDNRGPEISLYFKDQENFNSGDLVSRDPWLIAEIHDESGVNLTREVGHTIEIKIDDIQVKDITSFFSYQRDSYTQGKLTYHLENLESGEHHLLLQAWDNSNNPSREEIIYKITAEEGAVLTEVYNYPNPFSSETNFTFQVQGLSADAEVQIRIYTIQGRLIRRLDQLPRPLPGFNYYPWNGRDEDGDILANGVYLYKIILKNEGKQQEVIEKLVIIR
jgi:hypothetical protein